MCISILNQKDVRETSIFSDFQDLHHNISLAIEANPVNVEAEGVVENMIKKLFHLAVQVKYDSAKQPFYLARSMENIFADKNKLDDLRDMVYGWFPFEEASPDESRRIFDKLWNGYVEEYKRAVKEGLIPITIYDDKKYKYLPQPTLIDISSPVTIKLTDRSAYTANSLSTEATVYEELPDENGDDQWGDLDE